MQENIYIQLLGEGTTVYRPVPSTKLYSNTYIIGGGNIYDPEDEEWEFTPKEIVQVEKRELEGEMVLVAINKMDKVSIELTNEEALVFYDWLCRFNKSNNPGLFEDQSEERVLWDLEASLEKITSATFEKDYSVILEKAREKVRDETA